MNLQDLEKLQELYPEYQVELMAGKLILTPPSDMVSGIVGAHFGRLLANWVYEHELGHVFGARVGIQLPNGDLLSPRVSFVSYTRLKNVTRSYVSVVPELIVEIKLVDDRIRTLEEKITLFLEQGAQVGIVIDPDERTISLYHNAEMTTDDGDVIPRKTTLHSDDILTIPELFPGWEVAINKFWCAVYD